MVLSAVLTRMPKRVAEWGMSVKGLCNPMKAMGKPVRPASLSATPLPHLCLAAVFAETLPACLPPSPAYLGVLFCWLVSNLSGLRSRQLCCMRKT